MSCSAPKLGWTFGRLNHMRGGEGFAGPGDPQQHLIAFTLFDAVNQFFDGGRLVAAGANSDCKSNWPGRGDG